MDKPVKTQKSEQTEPAIEKVDVVLIAEHEHSGELKKPGESIKVTQSQHEWLRTHGKVE
jgi:hypothetical protein